MDGISKRIGLRRGLTAVLYVTVFLRYLETADALAAGKSPPIGQSLPNIILQSKNNLISAAVARGVSIAAGFPIDTYKTIVQISVENEPSSFASFILAGNVAAVYSGLVPALIGQIPYGILTFGGYEIYKKLIFGKFPDLQSSPLPVYIVAAVLGDLTGSVWLCPSEVIKQQMQSGLWAESASGALGVASGILERDGPFGFYRGYASNVVRDVPFRVFQLSTYEVIKGYYLKSQQKSELSALEAAVIGGIAGTVSAAITTPLDVIKSSMMTGTCSGGIDASWGACFDGIYASHGIAGLFAGIVPRIELIGLMSALFFVINEAVLQVLEKRDTMKAEPAAK